MTLTLGTLQLQGMDLQEALVCVPWSGVWFADCDLVSGTPPSGRVTLQLGDLALVGTVEPRHSGSFGERSRVRVLGGAGRWGELLPRRPGYANDAGVKASLVASDAARDCGEILDTSGLTARLGSAYAREEGPAWRILEDALRGTPWRVDYDGVTRVGARAPGALGPSALLLEWDAQSLAATLSCNSLRDVPIGATLPADERLKSAQVIRSLEFHVKPSGVRVRAWCGQGAQSSLAETLKALVERFQDQRLLGSYAYRVARMNGDRVNLQAESVSSGLPDLITVPMWPGVSGAHATLTLGALVAVQFLNGDRARPFISNFVGRGGPGDVPQALELGGSGGALAARQGDPVDVLIPPAIFSGTIGGAPATGVLTFPMAKTLGTITGGSAKGIRIK